MARTDHRRPELTDIDFVGAASFGVGEIGEPLELGRRRGQVKNPELRRGQGATAARVAGPHQVFAIPSAISEAALLDDFYQENLGGFANFDLVAELFNAAG